MNKKTNSGITDLTISALLAALVVAPTGCMLDDGEMLHEDSSALLADEALSGQHDEQREPYEQATEADMDGSLAFEKGQDESGVVLPEGVWLKYEHTNRLIVPGRHAASVVVFGGPCTSGRTQHRFYWQQTSGNIRCDKAQWYSYDPTDCRVTATVKHGSHSGTEGVCRLRIYER